MTVDSGDGPPEATREPRDRGAGRVPARDPAARTAERRQ